MAKHKKKKGGLAEARKRMEEKGTVGSYGHHSEKQEKRDIKKGGKIAKKAQFALNMKRLAAKRKGKKSHKRSRKR